MTSPVVARKIGIAIIFEELSIVKDLDVASNIFLDQEPVRKKFFLNETEIYSQSARLLEALELNIAPTAMVGSLTIGQQQMIEMAKAFASEAQLIVMDEPTSALSQKDKEELFKGISPL